MKIPSVCSIELNFYLYTFCIKKHYLNWSMVLTLLQHRWYVFYKSKEYDDLVFFHLKRHHGNNERPDPTSSVLTNNELFL